MSADTDFKYQFSFKNGNDLDNVRADSDEEAVHRLTFYHTTLLPLVTSIRSVAHGASAVAQQIPVTPVVQTGGLVQPAAQQWAPVDPGPPPAVTWGPPTAAPQQYGASPACAHGPRVAKSGSSAKGPWRAYMCPTPKGTPGQCEPVWVKQGTPEWAGFPA